MSTLLAAMDALLRDECPISDSKIVSMDDLDFCKDCAYAAFHMGEHTDCSSEGEPGLPVLLRILMKHMQSDRLVVITMNPLIELT